MDGGAKVPLTFLARYGSAAIIIKNDNFLLTIFVVCQIILIFAPKLWQINISILSVDLMVAIEAGRLMLKRISELLQKNESFSIETTLSTRSYFRLVEKSHQQGYDVTLLYFWLKSPQQAIERVAERVAKGGHDIPKDIIIRRYWEGLDNLFKIYMPIVDTWILVNNSETPRSIVATGGRDQETAIKDNKHFKIIEEYVKR
jgi:predicted ABC-type ATPase